MPNKKITTETIVEIPEVQPPAPAPQSPTPEPPPPAGMSWDPSSGWVPRAQWEAKQNLAALAEHLRAYPGRPVPSSLVATRKAVP